MTAPERQRPPPGELCLDHLAHFVPDLDAAAAVWEKLGFAVTPISVHQVSGKPAGTSNRCVMLEEGYLELLAPTSDTPNAQRVRDRMKRFVGVHLACFGTPAAAAEHARLAAHGFEPDPVVNLERKLDTGESVRFSVVYVPPAKMPEGRVQYCEHLTPRASLARRLRQPVSPARRLCSGGRAGGGSGALGTLRRPAAATGGRLRPPRHRARTRGDRHPQECGKSAGHRARGARTRRLCALVQSTPTRSPRAAARPGLNVRAAMSSSCRPRSAGLAARIPAPRRRTE